MSVLISKKEMVLNGRQVVSGEVLTGGLIPGVRHFPMGPGGRSSYYYEADRLEAVACPECSEKFAHATGLARHTELLHSQKAARPTEASEEGRVPPMRQWQAGTDPDAIAMYEDWRADCRACEAAYQEARAKLPEAKAKEAEARQALAKHRREGDPAQALYYPTVQALEYSAGQASKAVQDIEAEVREANQRASDVYHGGPQSAGYGKGIYTPGTGGRDRKGGRKR